MGKNQDISMNNIATVRLTVKSPLKLTFYCQHLVKEPVILKPQKFEALSLVSVQKMTDPIHCLNLTLDSMGENSIFRASVLTQQKKCTVVTIIYIRHSYYTA